MHPIYYFINFFLFSGDVSSRKKWDEMKWKEKEWNNKTED